MSSLKLGCQSRVTDLDLANFVTLTFERCIGLNPVRGAAEYTETILSSEGLAANV